MEAREFSRLDLLATSDAYEPNPHRPHSLLAQRSEEWSRYRNARMHHHMHVRTDRWRGRCEECGKRARCNDENCQICAGVKFDWQKNLKEEWRPTRLQVAHLVHNPDIFGPETTKVLCSHCHRKHDFGHQMFSSAVTMMCERQMLADRFERRCGYLAEYVEQAGLMGITPGGAEFALFRVLVGAGPLNYQEVEGRFVWLLGLHGEDVDEVRAIVQAAIKRTRKRTLPAFDNEGNLILHRGRAATAHRAVQYGDGLFWTTIPFLHLSPEITEKPLSHWDYRRPFERGWRTKKSK